MHYYEKKLNTKTWINSRWILIPCIGNVSTSSKDIVDSATAGYIAGKGAAIAGLQHFSSCAGFETTVDVCKKANKIKRLSTAEELESFNLIRPFLDAHKVLLNIQ
jgi:hypothetical protein